ncbi:MAG: hypothetical protein IKX70_02095 [Treponema sp.]|nr:hypothetical protein [Treponema sp.]
MIKLSVIPLEEKLKSEQRELFTHVQTEFWQGLFWKLLKDHTYQIDFFLVQQYVDMAEAVAHLKVLMCNLAMKYGLGFVESGSIYRMELNLRFHNYGIVSSMYDEVSIVICKDDISMRMLPHSPMLKIFSIDEYQLVGKLLQILCGQVFGERLEDFVKYLESYKRIETSTEGLTPKTIEIAQNSIRCIYEATDEKCKNLVQRNLYSSMRYRGRTFRVLHREFLQDPNVLLKELKEEKICQ